MIEIVGVALCGLFIYVLVTLVLQFLKALGELLEAIGNLLFSSEEKKDEAPPSSFQNFNSSSIFSYTPSPSKPESPYTRDWSSVSRKYKESRSWRCEECYVNLSDKRHRRLLHVHHRDNDPKNNSSWNLIALCVICHSERPGSGHKRLAGAIRTDGRYDEVQRLRW
jgi:hypothetical protein